MDNPFPYPTVKDPAEVIGPTIFTVKLVLEAKLKFELYVTVLALSTDTVLEFPSVMLAAGAVVAAVQVLGRAVRTCQLVIVVKFTAPFDR